MELQGKIVFIDPTRTPSEAKPDFKTRSFAIETEQEANFETVIKYWGFQTTKPEQLDGVGIGDTVKVVFNIRCSLSKRDVNKFSPTAQNPNNQSVFASLDCVKLEVTNRVAQHNNPATTAVTETKTPQPQPEGAVPEGKEWNGFEWVDAAPF